MYRKFIATVAAASIALTAMGSAPAVAGDDQTARTIAAILGLAAIGAIVHENRKDRNERDQILLERGHNDYRKPAPVYKQPRADNPPRYSVPKPRPLPQRVDRRLLPQECLQSFETRRGKVRMFGARCLNRSYDFANRLPRECEYVFDTRRGDRRGYEARCLRDRGYRLARG
jgi:hypothetical protein